MKQVGIIIFFTALTFLSCQETVENNNPKVETATVDTTNIEHEKTSDIDPVVATEEEVFYEDFSQDLKMYAIIIDTSSNYYYLRNKMFELSEKTNTIIDTMGRMYLSDKDIIGLPYDDEDEIYAGDYFPRRYASNTLSLEHYDFYVNFQTSTKFALIGGLFQFEEELDSAITVYQNYVTTIDTSYKEYYQGCMH